MAGVSVICEDQTYIYFSKCMLGVILLPSISNALLLSMLNRSVSKQKNKWV